MYERARFTSIIHRCELEFLIRAQTWLFRNARVSNISEISSVRRQARRNARKRNERRMLWSQVFVSAIFRSALNIESTWLFSLQSSVLTVWFNHHHFQSESNQFPKKFRKFFGAFFFGFIESSKSRNRNANFMSSLLTIHVTIFVRIIAIVETMFLQLWMMWHMASRQWQTNGATLRRTSWSWAVDCKKITAFK